MTSGCTAPESPGTVEGAEMQGQLKPVDVMSSSRIDLFISQVHFCKSPILSLCKSAPTTQNHW